MNNLTSLVSNNPKLDGEKIKALAQQSGWILVREDLTQGLLMFDGDGPEGKPVHINIWTRRGTLAIQTARLQLYKKWCDYQFIEKVFKNEDLGENPGFKVVRQQ